MYKILLKGTSGAYKLATYEKEITTTVTDAATNVEETVGTGKYETVVWTGTTEDDLEAKCIELLKQYPSTSILPVKDMSFEIDLIFS